MVQVFYLVLPLVSLLQTIDEANKLSRLKLPSRNNGYVIQTNM